MPPNEPPIRNDTERAAWGTNTSIRACCLTLAQIDRHAKSIEEIDVEGILTFAERILPPASDLWVQASLDHKQRLQQLFFPEGIAFDGNRFNRTAATAPFFKYLAPNESAEESLVSQEGIALAKASPEGEAARLNRSWRNQSERSEEW